MVVTVIYIVGGSKYSLHCGLLEVLPSPIGPGHGRGSFCAASINRAKCDFELHASVAGGATFE